jgi:hypothetical protein
MSGATNLLDSVELGDMVRTLVEEIARAQFEMDMNSIRTAEMLAKSTLDFDGEKISILELGFAPTFYQFVDSHLEVKVSVSMTQETSKEKKTSKKTEKTKSETEIELGWFTASATTTTTTSTKSVDARFASRFQYSAEASSAVSTRIAPVPPPGPLMELIRSLSEE